MKAVVSSEGQVTIPRALRERLGIRPEEVLYLEAERGRLVATKDHGENGLDAREQLSRQERLDRIDAALLAATGSSDLNMTSDEFMEWVQGPRGDL